MLLAIDHLLVTTSSQTPIEWSLGSGNLEHHLSINETTGRALKKFSVNS